MTATVPSSKHRLPARTGRLRLLVALAMLMALGALVIEHWHGERALRSWMQQHPEQNDSLNFTLLWPKPEERARKFHTDLIEATRQLPEELTSLGGQITGMVSNQSGTLNRGSQETKPPLPSSDSRSWSQLEAAVTKGTVPLRRLRELIRQAPSAMAGEITHRMATDDFFNYSGSRRGAQTLHAAVIIELHRGNRDAALENLLSMLALTRLYSDEPTLVNYMIRVAILGLSLDACWDALQEPGWSDSQLAQLQHAVDSTRMLQQLPHVVKAERAARLASWKILRSHSYQYWMNRYGDLGKGFGITFPDSTRGQLAQRWTEWGFHPLWQYAWADQEELHYLQHSQTTLTAVSDSIGQRSWQHLQKSIEAIERNYQPPAGQWRFHGRLPILDDLSMVTGAPPGQRPRGVFLDYRQAWAVTFEHLTVHQLFATAVAIRRYSLRHGAPPETLDALVPALLPETPRDFMDGAPLRYRRNTDHTFRLYSVGANSRDDGGDVTSEPAQSSQRPSCWSGRDWVWFQSATPGKP